MFQMLNGLTQDEFKSRRLDKYIANLSDGNPTYCFPHYPPFIHHAPPGSVMTMICEIQCHVTSNKCHVMKDLSSRPPMNHHTIPDPDYPLNTPWTVAIKFSCIFVTMNHHTMCSKNLPWSSKHFTSRPSMNWSYPFKPKVLPNSLISKQNSWQTRLRRLAREHTPVICSNKPSPTIMISFSPGNRLTRSKTYFSVLAIPLISHRRIVTARRWTQCVCLWILWFG